MLFENKWLQNTASTAHDCTEHACDPQRDVMPNLPRHTTSSETQQRHTAQPASSHSAMTPLYAAPATRDANTPPHHIPTSMFPFRYARRAKTKHRASMPATSPTIMRPTRKPQTRVCNHFVRETHTARPKSQSLKPRCIARLGFRRGTQGY